MAIKLTELTGTVDQLRNKVEKIWGEQQRRYDALVEEFNRVKEQLANIEVPPAAQASLDAFDARLTAFDDTIPDLEPPTEPPVEPPTEPPVEPPTEPPVEPTTVLRGGRRIA